MASSNPMSKLNWRLMVIHFIACWFFIHASKVLFSLHDHEFLMNVIANRNTGGLNAGRFANDVHLLSLAGYAGLIVGCILSIMISLKQRWYWINTLIIFVVAGVLERFELLGWNALQSVFTSPGDLLNLPSPWYYLLNGGIMVAVGLVLFFLKGPVQFINGKSKA